VNESNPAGASSNSAMYGAHHRPNFEKVLRRLGAQRPMANAAYASMPVRLAEAKSAGLLTIEPFVLNATPEPPDPETLAFASVTYRIEAR
jgi:hypothetical protein